MNAKTFLAIVSRIFEPELAHQGYIMDIDPPGFDEKGNVWFEKKLQEGVFVLIHIQPSPWYLDNLISFAINLIRNSPMYRRYRGWQTVPGYFLGERLASALWISDRHDPEWEPDHWWSFPDEDALEQACHDALDKLIRYGIPYLEDLTTKSLRVQG